MGRADRYDTHVKPFLQEIARWKTTMTEEQIAEQLGIAYSTLQKYKNQHDELREILLFGDRKNEQLVYSALLKKALGYDYFEENGVLDKDGKVVMVPKKRHQPMSEKAADMWLRGHSQTYHTSDAEEIKIRRREMELKEQKEDDAKWD